MVNRLDIFAIPFPSNLMSTARTPTDMPLQFARDILNMYSLKSGAGTKRNGVVKEGNALSSGNIKRLMNYVKPAGDLQVLAYTDEGKIYLKDGEDWVEKYSGLDTSGTIRWTHFAGKLIITNGIDPILEWDGTTASILYELVEDTSANLTYVNSTTFTIDSEAALYPVGFKVKARLGDAESFVESTVASVSGTSTITVVLDDAVLTSDLDEIHYEARPPAFAFIYAAHDRLWGFGKGPLKANSFSDSVDRNRIYYTSGVVNPTDWYDSIGTLQSINLEDKMPAIDELVAMAVKDNMTVFFFRNYLQVWSGVDPTVTGDFSWAKTVPMGAIHGDLVVEMPNDIGFFTRFGARTLSRILQTEQLDVGDLGSEIDATISDSVLTMLSSDANYRDVHSFKNDRQGWFGFKPAGKALVFQTTGATAGWTVFDGKFEEATAFLNTPNGKLYMAVGSQLYCYDETVWDDDSTAIQTRWWTPWLNFSSTLKRWANKYVEVISEQGEPILLTLKRYKNFNASSFSELQVTIPKEADYWSNGQWEVSQWDNVSPEPQKKRDHFVSEVMAYAVESNSTDGPMTIFGLKLHGTKEK